MHGAGKMCYTLRKHLVNHNEAIAMTESVVETNEPPREEPLAEDLNARLNPPDAFTTFLIAAAVAYVGMLFFVFAFGLYGDELTSGIDRACAEAAFQGGKEAEGQGNYELAIQRYHQALEGRFDDKAREYECGRSIGEVLLRLGRYEEAVDAYRSLAPEAFTLPGHWTGYVTALFRAGQYEQAERLGIEWLGKAQAAKDQQQVLWASATMGQTAEQLGKLDDAFNYYRMTTVVAPDGDGSIRMANILHKLGRIPEAIRQLDAYLARVTSGPLHEEAVKLRAQCEADAVPAQ